MAQGKRYICVHGHFYQPPRENPWLESVEIQDSAAPFHDWNERVCSECYAPNGAARILNGKKLIGRIANNYARISFNFGPTLLDWLSENAPRTYRMILEGERRSRVNFSGHSSAMAQAYNHIILPLASQRDRMTQIRWGIADYEHHFSAEPEGMWLAETAADNETLELLAQHGIKYTVLAPHQCHRIRLRKDPDAQWTETPDASVDTTRPYLVHFKSGVSIAVFFYNGPTSRAIAFEGLLNSGETLAARLKAGFHDSAEAQLSSVATDGETYGHHHKHGEMALAFALTALEKDTSVRLTNFASFLAKFPPEYECEIVENTSWSCAHGVERWRSNCGCNGGRQGWNQKWRGPLREALDALRDSLVSLTEQEGEKLFHDVWAARDGYIQVILDRNPESTELFFNAHQNHLLSDEERARALRLMEMERHAQLMYTSCGWFFDDIAGIETVQIIAYAARVIQLAVQLFGEQAAAIEPAFLDRLAQAKSNDPAAGDGAAIYRQCVATKALTFEQVAAHYAISSVFTPYPAESDLYCYRVRRISQEVFTSGRGRVALGRIEIENTITRDGANFSFAVLHFGDQNITAAVRPCAPEDAAGHQALAARIGEQVQRADFPEVIRLIDSVYGHADYSLASLFTDEQRRIVQLILNSTLWDIESSLTAIYEDHASLLHYLAQSGLHKPRALTLAAGFAINAGLRRIFESDDVDAEQMRSLLQRAKADQVELETPMLTYLADLRMKRAMVELQISAGSIDQLERALTLAQVLSELPFETNLWQAQNIWYEMLRTPPDELAHFGKEERQRWDSEFDALARCLSIDATDARLARQTAEAPAD